MNRRLDLSTETESLVRELTEQVLGLLAPAIRKKVDELVRDALLENFNRHSDELGRHVRAVARVPGTDPYVATQPKRARKTPQLVLEMVRMLPPEDCTTSRVIMKICAAGEYKENTVYRAITRLIDDGKLLRKGVEHLSLASR